MNKAVDTLYSRTVGEMFQLPRFGGSQFPEKGKATNSNFRLIAKASPAPPSFIDITGSFGRRASKAGVIPAQQKKNIATYHG